MILIKETKLDNTFALVQFYVEEFSLVAIWNLPSSPLKMISAILKNLIKL